MSASYEQSEIKNVHKPKPSDTCDATPTKGRTVDSNEGYKMALYFLVQKTPTEPKAVMKFKNMDLVYRYHKTVLPQTALPMTATMYKRVAELDAHYFMFRRISVKEYRKSYASLILKEYKLVFDFEKE